MKGIRKGYRFCQNGIQKGKGLDLRAEPPRLNLCRVVAFPRTLCSTMHAPLTRAYKRTEGKKEVKFKKAVLM